MYDQIGDDGKTKWTFAEIAAESGVTRPAIYRYVDQASTASTAAPESAS